MKFFCNGCEQEKDDEDMVYVSTINFGKDLIRFCKGCRNVSVSFPDVYWDGKPEENLADDPLTGRPRVFSSKGEKAAYLKEKGLREAGDRVNGSYILNKHVPRETNDRHEVRTALKKVRDMGIDVRRQAFLKLMKQAGERRV